MKLSYTAISTYQNCPLQYRYRYVEGIPSQPSPALSFGRSLHTALQWFYDVSTPHPCALEELIAYLDQCWDSEGYSSGEEETRYFYHARSVLEMYYRNNVREFRIPAALEHRFGIDLGFCTLTGVIDRLDKDPHGGFEIIDYKTNRRLPPAKFLARDLQLPIYHIAVKRIWEVEAARVTFYYLLINHRHSVPVTPERENEALEVIRKTAFEIERGCFDPRPNNLCPWCDYISKCPEWQGRPVPAKKGSGPPELDIGQAVDELIATGKQLENLTKRHYSLREIVSNYLLEQGIKAVGGSRGLASLDSDGRLAWSDEVSASEDRDL